MNRELVELRSQLEELADRLVKIETDPRKDDMPMHGIQKATRKLALRVAGYEISEHAYFLGQHIKVVAGIDPPPITRLELKRDCAKTINAVCARWGVAIAHPDSGEPCTLLVINDKADGRFVLENRQTKKRTNTATDITGLMPLKVVDVSATSETS